METLINIYVIGCGGIGGWLAQCLGKMLDEHHSLELIDKDRFEKKNMDRQLGCRIGMNKARALRDVASRGARCDVFATTDWYLGEPHLEEILFPKLHEHSVLFCAADNHRARSATLRWADRAGCAAYICANEYTDAEAYAYFPEWRDSRLDPRVFYPDILTDTTDDPLSPPCTGEILESSPQLALANMSAANYGLWLWYFWTNVAPKITDPDARDTCIYHVSSSDGNLVRRTLKEGKEQND